MRRQRHAETSLDDGGGIWLAPILAVSPCPAIADGITMSYLRDTLSPLSAAENGPGDAARVLALEEKRFGLAILKAKDLAVRANEDLAL